MTTRSPKVGWQFPFGVGLSLVIHCCFALWLLSRQPETPGAIDLPTAAISINVETTDILDADEQSPAQKADAAPSAVAETAPPEETTMAEESIPPEPEPEQAAKDDQAKEAERQRLAHEALRKAEEEERQREEIARQARQAEASRLAEEEKRKQTEVRQKRLAEEREREKKLAEERERREQARKRSIEDRKNAPSNRQATASGKEGAQTTRGRVSASRGSLLNYAAEVRARIARNKPPSARESGVVILSFTLSRSGGLVSARVARSSGNSALDEAALMAVRRASPFPLPPEEATSSQLRFTIPFQYR